MAGSSRRHRVEPRFGCAALIAASAWALLATSGAEASTVSVGSPLGASFSVVLKISPSAAIANTSLPEPGANVFSPVSGVVVRWRLTGAFSGGPFRLQVLRPAMGGQYTNVATSEPQTPSGTSLQTFTSNVPIQAGDLIALADTNETDTFGIEVVPSSTLGYWNPVLVEGATAAPAVLNGFELGLNADVQPAPGLVLIAPPSGPITGGTVVTIAGHDFAGVSAVKFGAIPATSFTVNSENSITAVAPASSTPGTVDVSVTTVGGTTPAATSDQFTYTNASNLPGPAQQRSCVVPKLTGKSLKSARKKLKKAECKLGKVKGQKSKRARIEKQSAKPGKVLAPGAKVNVKLTG
jgi:hypothetical protein